jgi:FAD/FMN-containing dehydrogenase
MSSTPITRGVEMLKTNTAPATMLSDVVSGHVAHRGDPGWDRARRPFAVVFPADERDVAAVVRFARVQGLRVAPQATADEADSLRATILVATPDL